MKRAEQKSFGDERPLTTRANRHCPFAEYSNTGGHAAGSIRIVFVSLRCVGYEERSSLVYRGAERARFSFRFSRGERENRRIDPSSRPHWRTCVSAKLGNCYVVGKSGEIRRFRRGGVRRRRVNRVRVSRHEYVQRQYVFVETRTHTHTHVQAARILFGVCVSESAGVFFRTYRAEKVKIDIAPANSNDDGAARRTTTVHADGRDDGTTRGRARTHGTAMVIFLSFDTNALVTYVIPTPGDVRVV